jgi:hypothetical protein
VSLPWSGQQIEWLQAMGLEVLRRPDDPRDSTPPVVPTGAHGSPAGITADISASGGDVPRGLLRAARGLDLAPLLAATGVPRDIASRRAFWRLLRQHRKAARPR